MVVNICETTVVLICFIVGGLHWSGAAEGNKAAGTALVSSLNPQQIATDNLAGNLLPLAVHLPDHRPVLLPLLR